MLPSVDPEGFRTGRQAVSHALGLLMVSLTPFVFKLTGLVYLAGALLCGVIFVFYAVRFSRQLNRRSARQLFLASILYLPLLLGLMVIDKLKY
jgi:protoheme IX farnesyltransferase